MHDNWGVMAISFELQAHSDAAVHNVFRTFADLRSWDSFAGVVVLGPERTIVAGDRLDVCLRVVRRDITAGCVVRTVDEPTRRTPGYVDIRSVEGPFDARLSGTVTPVKKGCELCVQVDGVGRGPARFLETAVDLLMQRWATHQLNHLLQRAASPQAMATR